MTNQLRKHVFPGEFTPASNHWLKIVIGYGDLADGHRAMKTCQRLIERLGREFQFSTSLWKFNLLGAPKQTKAAAQDAAEADMLIISTRGVGELPGEVKKWVSALAGKGRGGARALIALLDEADERGEGVSPIHSYLQKVAQQANVEFFSSKFPDSASRGGLPAITSSLWGVATRSSPMEEPLAQPEAVDPPAIQMSS